MKTRRQEKVARIIKESVSDCLANHLSDPRIEGLVSVTKVDVAADIRNAEVYISVLGKNEASQNKTFNAIVHASGRIQAFTAQWMKSKFCPVLHFKNDENFKKTIETIKLIDDIAKDFKPDLPPRLASRDAEAGDTDFDPRRLASQNEAAGDDSDSEDYEMYDDDDEESQPEEDIE
jgi:ribosome-binding factor A